MLPLLAAVILVAWGGILMYNHQAKGQEDPPALEADGGQYGAPVADGTVTNTSTPAAGPENSVSHPAATREQIEQEYINQLQTLASGYEARLNALVSSALLEIETARKVAPDADIGPLADKYYRDGLALEAACDEQFYLLLAEFTSALRAGSYPLDAAVATREAYEAQKSARGSGLNY